jgi:hypothetical protein
MADHHDHGAGMPMSYGGQQRMGFPPGGGGWQQQAPAGVPASYSYVPVASGGVMLAQPGVGMPRGPPAYGGAPAGAGSSSSAPNTKAAAGAAAAAAAAAVNRGKWTVEEVRTGSSGDALGTARGGRRRRRTRKGSFWAAQ